jgi:putative spermidine/putrescine transport system permease protein
VFFGIPLLVVIAFSFFDLTASALGIRVGQLRRAVRLRVTLSLYFQTITFADRGAITLAIGLPSPTVFHVRNIIWQMALFLLHGAVWTSNIIRMISWIPFLGRNGSSTRR